MAVKRNHSRWLILFPSGFMLGAIVMELVILTEVFKDDMTGHCFSGAFAAEQICRCLFEIVQAVFILRHHKVM